MARQQKIDFFGNFRPTGVDPTAGSTLRALAGLSSDIGDLAFGEAKKQAEKRGRLEGARAGLEAQGLDEPLILEEEGFIGSIETEAYNKSLQSAYLASLDNDNRTEIARIADENPNDTAAFDQLTSSYASAVLSNIDPSAAPAAQLTMNTLISTARQKIQSAELGKNVREADNLLILSAETSIRDAMRFANEGQLEAAGMSLSSAFTAITARVESGQLDPAAAIRLKRKLKIATDVEVNRFTFSNKIKNEGIISAVTFLQKASDKPLKGFGVDEQRVLIETLKSDLNQFIQLGNAVEKEQQETWITSQKAESADLFVGIATGQTDSADVSLAISQKQISFEQGKGLLNILNTRGQGIDDHALINDINLIMTVDTDLAERMIIQNTGSRLTEATATQLFQTVRSQASEESPLKTSEAIRFKSFLSNSVKVVGPLGAIDFESQKRLAQLTVAYDQRILSGEDPATVAADLIDVNDFLLAPNPLTGTKENLPGALETLNAQFDAKTISDSEYDREVELIKKLMEQQTNIEQFLRALKEAGVNG